MILRSEFYRLLASGALMPSMLVLAGCEQLTPNGETGTMALLRSGSEKVCVAADVQSALHNLIVPKPAEISDAGSMEDKLTAVRAVALSYDLTTLQSFDKAVARASCNTTLQLSGPGGKSDKFPINFQVSPSADSAGTFVVTADVASAKVFSAALLTDALNGLDDQRQQAANAQQAADDRARFLATITPKWLVGTWIEASAPATNCAGPDTMSFQSNHVYEGRLFTGRWSLQGDQLHRIGSGAQGGGDETDTIVAADAISFTLAAPDGTSQSARRCTREEVASPDPTIIDHMDTPQ